MQPRGRATLTGIVLVVITTLGGGIGIATIIAKPFGSLQSIFIGFTYVAASILAWGAACALGKRFFE